MAVLLQSPKFQFSDSTGTPYAGGSLTFYLTGTTTPQDTFTTEALNVANSNPVTLNSAGWPATDIFLTPGVKYKVVLKDSSGNTIWTVDPVSTTDLARVPLWTENAGNPNGSVAGTAASSGVMPSIVWDRTNSILYVCTTTGSSSTAVWTALNASSATPVVVQPQGYLTMTSGTPIISTEVVAGTAVYYTPFVGNLVPIYNGSSMIPTTFSELTLTLAAQHLANQIYDVFVFSNSGVVTLATGPAWATPTAGAGARGTGAGTTELTRLNGYWVNAVQITGRNGASTYTIAANRATYLGSIYMDGTNGQLTCHRSWGQSRKWGVWNAYNRQPLYLKAGDSTASWNYTTDTARPSNNNTANSLTVFQGLAEEWYNIKFSQLIEAMAVNSGSTWNMWYGIGFNSTSTMSGKIAKFGGFDINSGNRDHRVSEPASFLQVPSLGINVVTALERVPNYSGTNNVFIYGGEDDMELSAIWRG